MNIFGVKFLAKANSKRNNNSKSIKILVCLLVATVSLILSFTVVTVKAVNQYKSDSYARSLTLTPWKKQITNAGLNDIRKVNHVVSVDDVSGMEGSSGFTVEKIDADREDLDKLNTGFKKRDNMIYLCREVGNEKKPVVAGNALDNAKIYSCIVPSLFYPFEDEGNINYENLEYINGVDLIGTTITLKGIDNSITIPFNYIDKNGECINSEETLKTEPIKLNVVGVYPCSAASHGYFADVFVSKETEDAIIKKAAEKSGINLKSKKSKFSKWWNTSSLHTYFVTTDNVDNMSGVYNDISGMGYEIADESNYSIKDSIIIMSSLFCTVGTFIIFAMCIIAFIMLIQSAKSSILKMQSEIGLLKAIGYKNKHILVCVLCEHMSMIVKGFVIGSLISVLFVSLTNYIFSHKSYNEFLYIISYSDLLKYLSLILVFIIVVFFICEIITIKKIVQIKPIEAMSGEHI